LIKLSLISDDEKINIVKQKIRIKNFEKIVLQEEKTFFKIIFYNLLLVTHLLRIVFFGKIQWLESIIQEKTAKNQS
jgi:hypothetical protein